MGSSTVSPTSTPVITIITPAYNVAEYVGETIASVLAQTEPRFEYLVVDDGSDDGTLAIARDAQECDPRVRVIEGRHAGSSAARNLGLVEARGEFIAFCDADDRWDPRLLETLHHHLTSAGPDIGATFTGFRYIDAAGRPLGRTQVAPSGDYDAAAMLAGHCPPGNGSCLLIRQSCFHEAGLFDEDLRNCVDMDMWIRIGIHAKSPTFRMIDDVLVDWRVRPGAISSSEARRVEGLHEIFRRYDYLLKPSHTAQAYAWPALLAFYAGRDDLARQWTKKVRKADPWFAFRGVNNVALATFMLLGGKAGRRLRSVARKLAQLRPKSAG